MVPIFVRVDPFESTIGKQTVDEHGVMLFPLITKKHIFVRKKARDVFGVVDIPVSKVFRAFFLMKNQIYKLFGTKWCCSCNPSVDGCLKVTLAKMTENDSQVVSRFSRQSSNS